MGKSWLAAACFLRNTALMRQSRQPLLVDSHAHWDFSDFDGEHDDLWTRARAAGVGTVLSIGTTPERWSKILQLVERYPNMYATVGVHPCDSAPVPLEGVEELLCTSAAHPKVVGLGETGLDFFHKPFDQAHQEAMFCAHMDVGCALDLPLIVHTREAEEATLTLLKEGVKKGVRGVIHCFSGSLAFAKSCLELGFFISFSGIITFKNAKALRDVVAAVPLERILVETDAPYLAPHPYRGKRNESSYVRYVANQVADIKGLPFEEIAHATSQNFFRLFLKAQPPEAL